MVISPRVTSPHATDFSSLKALFASPRLASKKGQDLAIAIWELIVDKREGLYHSCPPIERLTDHFVWDPLKIFNCFGWSICGLTADLMAVLYKAAGFADARIANLKEHEAAEVFYDGGWHLLDGDLQAFHRRHSPHQDVIASHAECLADPTLVSRQQNPSTPYYLPDRPPDKMAELYEVAPSYDRAYAEPAHTMDFVLRPGERLERQTFHEGRWIWFSNYNEFKSRWPSEWKDDGPWERFPPHRRFGNGRWVYRPNLTRGFRDFELGVLEADGIEAGERGATVVRQGAASCTFEFASPYPYAGTPAREGKEAPRNGCLVETTIAVAEGSAARLRLAVDPDLPWFTVWESPGPGLHRMRLDLTEHVVNAYRYLLRFEFDARPPEGGTTNSGIERLRVESWFMVAPGSLGRLVEGDNELTVRFGDEKGLPTRRLLVETNFRDEADVGRKACRLDNARFVPDPADRILPADPARPYEVVFKVEAPPHGMLQRLYAFGAFRGKAPDDPAEDRVAAYLGETQNGPWHPIFDDTLIAERHRWHFDAQGEAVLPRPAKTVFVRFAARVGLINGKIRAHYLDDRVAAIRTPILVTHVWEEAGARRSHTERIERPGEPHAYRIACGSEPRFRSVLMAVGHIAM
ncbi:MAG: hypothetical protein FJ290_11205 [Planctomycetes bacterium]|nr:hypothetical protein [Planctomycetota bacterium]